MKFRKKPWTDVSARTIKSIDFGDNGRTNAAMTRFALESEAAEKGDETQTEAFWRKVWSEP